MDYLKKKLYIAQVNTYDEVTDKVERWEAHKQGLLHRAFTIAIAYKDTYILQHRKHPVFDQVFDVTISSHPVFTGELLQPTLDAVYATLDREWSIDKKSLHEAPKLKGKIYYKSKDPHSRYTEHEICYVYTCRVETLTLPNLDFSYGFSLLPAKTIKDKKSPVHPLLAPWVQEMITHNLL